MRAFEAEGSSQCLIARRATFRSQVDSMWMESPALPSSLQAPSTLDGVAKGVSAKPPNTTSVPSLRTEDKRGTSYRAHRNAATKCLWCYQTTGWAKVFVVGAGKALVGSPPLPSLHLRAGVGRAGLPRLDGPRIFDWSNRRTWRLSGFLGEAFLSDRF